MELGMLFYGKLLLFVVSVIWLIRGLSDYRKLVYGRAQADHRLFSLPFAESVLYLHGALIRYRASTAGDQVNSIIIERFENGVPLCRHLWGHGLIYLINGLYVAFPEEDVAEEFIQDWMEVSLITDLDYLEI